MKKIFVFLLLTSVLFVSCKPKEKPETPAKAVRFTTSSVAVNTKTAYSGTVQDGVEAILWDNGDEFTVWCNEASVEGSTQKFADYRVGTDLGSVTSVTGDAGLANTASSPPSGAETIDHSTLSPE